MKAFITGMEIYDDESCDHLLAKLESFDADVVQVEIKTAFTSEEWKELAEVIYNKLKDMEV